MAPLLSIERLTVAYGGGSPAVRSVSLALQDAETLGVVGESGSGKTQLFLAAAGLSPPSARVTGSARFRGQDLVAISKAARRTLLGREIAFVFQNPMTGLTPHLRIGEQLVEALVDRGEATREEAVRRALDMLERVRIAEPRLRLRQFPHEISGGMRQRVLLAIALLGSPALLIADEPTTALDVTTQAEILDVIDEARRSLRFGLVFITHDLATLARVCGRVCVMRAGEIVEDGPLETILTAPSHPYTRQLLDAARALDLP